MKFLNMTLLVFTALSLSSHSYAQEIEGKAVEERPYLDLEICVIEKMIPIFEGCDYHDFESLPTFKQIFKGCRTTFDKVATALAPAEFDKMFARVFGMEKESSTKEIPPRIQEYNLRANAMIIQANHYLARQNTICNRNEQAAPLFVQINANFPFTYHNKETRYLAYLNAFCKTVQEKVETTRTLSQYPECSESFSEVVVSNPEGQPTPNDFKNQSIILTDK